MLSYSGASFERPSFEETQLKWCQRKDLSLVRSSFTEKYVGTGKSVLNDGSFLGKHKEGFGVKVVLTEGRSLIKGSFTENYERERFLKRWSSARGDFC